MRAVSSRGVQQLSKRLLGARALSTERWKLGQVSAKLTVPDGIERPPYVVDPSVLNQPKEFVLRTGEEIERMRVSCRIASQIRAFAGSLVKPGVTTDEIDKLVHEKVVSLGVYPSPLGYRNFPKSCCTSVNQVICHGIPDSRPLEDGDIVNVDVSCWVGGFHGDCSATFLVGDVSHEHRRLVRATRESLDEAIAICKPGAQLKQIGHTINDIADRLGYGVVRDFCGHGIGYQFHMLPDILHFRNEFAGRMLPGMVFTIEPMLTIGDQQGYMMEDGWTIVTKDEKWSAQFEETLAITEDGVEILTKHEEEVF